MMKLYKHLQDLKIMRHDEKCKETLMNFWKNFKTRYKIHLIDYYKLHLIHPIINMFGDKYTQKLLNSY